MLKILGKDSAAFEKRNEVNAFEQKPVKFDKQGIESKNKENQILQNVEEKKERKLLPERNNELK